MRGSEEYQDWGIGQGFLRSREIHVVARDVGARFGGVPRETQREKVRRAAGSARAEIKPPNRLQAGAYPTKSPAKEEAERDSSFARSVKSDVSWADLASP